MVVLCTTDCVPKFECPRDSRAALREVKAVSALKLADEYVVSLYLPYTAFIRDYFTLGRPLESETWYK